MTRLIKFYFLILLITFPVEYIWAQEEIDIVPTLQKIESGYFESAEALLKEYKTQNPKDPSVMFLDAVLTKDGANAVEKYSQFVDKFPHHQYTDASLQRLFSYYYSIGHYKKASGYLDRLKKDFPDSPYLKTIDAAIPSSDSPEISSADSSSSIKPDTIKGVQGKILEKKKYNFTIQAGAFMNAENAKNLCESLVKEKYFTEIYTREIGGSILNIVNVGKFETEKEAAPVLTKLETKYNLKARIVKLNK
jgi:cell division septation protein DedD